MRHLSLSLLLIGLSGCFRLSDPFYLPRNISAGDRPGAEYSLLIGSVEVDGGLFGPDGIDNIYFRRLVPGGEADYWYVGELHLFRAFQTRHMRSGHFAIALPPGAYELERMEDTGWFQPTRFVLSEGTRRSSRFFITRPGIYDLGTLHISSPRGLAGPYILTRFEPENPELRAALIRELVKGTPWEHLLKEQHRDTPSRPGPNPYFAQSLP